MNEVEIRRVTPSDAAHLLTLFTHLDHETRFLMLEPGERKTTVEEQTRFIQTFLSKPNQMIFVAVCEDEIVGSLSAVGGQYQRNRRTAYLVIGVLEKFTGQGVGTRLFSEVEAWARQVDIHRLELTVMSHNIRAIALYEKHGFSKEGVRRDALFIEGKFVDEYHMAKILLP